MQSPIVNDCTKVKFYGYTEPQLVPKLLLQVSVRGPVHVQAVMVSTTEIFTDNSPISPMKPKLVKKPSAQKSLCMFTNILDLKIKTAYRQVGAAKYKRKAIKYVNTPWALKQKQKGHSKISE